jgi:hypothetical protein
VESTLNFVVGTRLHDFSEKGPEGLVRMIQRISVQVIFGTCDQDGFVGTDGHEGNDIVHDVGVNYKDSVL